MGTRRGHHEGTIRKRSDDRWEAIVSLPDGKRKSLYGKTRAEAVAKLHAVQEGLAKGIVPSSDLLTIRVFLEEWLEGIRPSVEFNSARRYADHVRSIIDILGSRHLTKLSVEDIRHLHGGLLSAGYAPATVRMVHTLLHQALKDAMAQGLVARNVTELIRPPKSDPAEMHPLTREQVRVFLTRSQSHRLHALFLLALASGLRLGELMALSWNDIDFARGILTVNHSAYFKTGSSIVIKSPKTKKSRRSIRLDAQVMAELKAHRARQNQERLAAGPVWLDRNLVFSNEGGVYLYPTAIRRVFKRLLRACELPAIRIHDLRHTAATLMLAKGVNIKVVSEMLGHSNVAITLTVYAHVTESMQEQAAMAMGQILFD